MRLFTTPKVDNKKLSQAPKPRKVSTMNGAITFFIHNILIINELFHIEGCKQKM